MLYFYHINNLTYHELKDQLTIGRTHGDLIFGSDPKMSGRHVQITLDPSAPQSAVIIEDLGAKNLTVVDKVQLSPNKKTRIKTHSLIEVGSQQFIVTDSKNMSLDTLNAIIDRNQGKPTIKAEGATPASGPASDDPLVAKERLLSQAEKELATYEQNTEQELLRLEQTKERLQVSLKSKKAEMAKKISSLKIEVEEARRVKMEVDNKAKKIISIKGI